MRSSQEANPWKSHMRSTWLEDEESCQAVSFASISRVRSSHEIVAKHSAWRIFKSDFLTLHPYYIYPHYPQKWRGHSERKTLREVSTTHPSIRESYPFLERNLCSLFSFPLPLLYLLRGDFYPNTAHTNSKCWECFWCYWEALEDAKDDGCNMELVAGSGELDKT